VGINSIFVKLQAKYFKKLTRQQQQMQFLRDYLTNNFIIFLTIVEERVYNFRADFKLIFFHLTAA